MSLITRPGVYQLTEDEYHGDPCPAPSLSSSLAKRLLAHSPRHAWTAHPRLNPDFERTESSDFDRGKAAHALLLEGDDRMAVLPFEDYRKNDAKAMRDAAREAGKYPVLEAQYPAILKMRDIAIAAIAACPDLGGLTLADGKSEQSMAWKEGAVWCRSRCDWLSNDRRIFIDYKSTAASANPEAWVRTMLGLGGDLQGAFYLRGNAATGGAEDAKFIFLVQENEPPFACCPIGLSPAFVELGHAKRLEAVALWQHCIADDDWPGYPKRVCWIEPPPWELTKWESRESAAAFVGEPQGLGEAWGAFEENAA